MPHSSTRHDVPMKMGLQMMLAVMLVVYTGGCDFGNPVCTGEAEPAVLVEVRHAQTGLPEADGVRGVLVEDGYTDSLIIWEETEEDVPLALAGGFERAGTYTVEINKSGFETWRRDGIRVEDGECGPKIRRLTARIEPVE